MTMHDSAQALRGKKLLLVGFTLFSMFFGAGNLIFPPFLGAQAGTALWLAFVGFAVSAIGLPIAGVAAVARAGGLPALAGRVHPRFAQVFAVLVYLSIGPCLAIPRTASTSFEMLTPLVGRSTPGQFIYSLVFFAAAYFVALKPEKLTRRLGRILCPALLVLIVVLFAGCILRPAAPGYGTPAEAYAALPAAQGVLDGYQTMDALAALNFGAVIALNIQAVGITEEAAVRRGTIRAGLIAGGMLLVVYAMLTHIGGISGAAFPGSDTGASVLTALADSLFGRVGQVLLAAIFVIACFNTCVGLIASVGEYFHELLPRLPYPAIAAFFALMSMLLANIGLAGILSLSVPVLNAIFEKIQGTSPYQSPTDMGVNMAGNCIVDDDAVCTAAKEEILRRYFTACCNALRGKECSDEIYKLELLLGQAGLNTYDRACAAAATRTAANTGTPCAAIELENGDLITGKTTELLGCASAMLLNALKHLGGIPDETLLISPQVIRPIQALKTRHLGSHNPRLHTDEVLIALSMCAVTDPNAALALEQLGKLRDCEVHCSVLLSSVDENTLKKLGVHLTCTAKSDKKLIY